MTRGRHFTIRFIAITGKPVADMYVHLGTRDSAHAHMPTYLGCENLRKSPISRRMGPMRKPQDPPVCSPGGPASLRYDALDVVASPFTSAGRLACDNSVITSLHSLGELFEKRRRILRLIMQSRGRPAGRRPPLSHNGR